ncbi:MAG: hypothetical protein AAB110_05795 [Candidatus Desantisbacteria bacterium]
MLEIKGHRCNRSMDGREIDSYKRKAFLVKDNALQTFLSMDYFYMFVPCPTNA